MPRTYEREHLVALTPGSATNQLKDIVEEHYGELLRVWDERFARSTDRFTPGSASSSRALRAAGICTSPPARPSAAAWIDCAV
jgi:hypothetical protein